MSTGQPGKPRRSAVLVPGHVLKNEGRVWSGLAWGTGPGVGRCLCGATSEQVTTNAARQEWHRHHKAEVLARTDGPGSKSPQP